MIEDLDREVWLALQSGFSGVRVTGEMSWALDLPSVLVRLCDYEEKLLRHWPSQLAGLCQYNEMLFADGVVKRMAVCHNIVVRDGKIVRQQVITRLNSPHTCPKHADPNRIPNPL